MANKGIPKIPLFDPFSQKMSCPLFGVPTVILICLGFRLELIKYDKFLADNLYQSAFYRRTDSVTFSISADKIIRKCIYHRAKRRKTD